MQFKVCVMFIDHLFDLEGAKEDVSGGGGENTNDGQFSNADMSICLGNLFIKKKKLR